MPCRPLLVPARGQVPVSSDTRYLPPHRNTALPPARTPMGHLLGRPPTGHLLGRPLLPTSHRLTWSTSRRILNAPKLGAAEAVLAFFPPTGARCQPWSGR